MPKGIYKRKLFTKRHKENISRGLKIAYKEHKRKPVMCNLGKKFSEETKKKMGLVHMGEKNPNWKGGRCIHQGRVWLSHKGVRILESHAIWLKYNHLLRIPTGCVIHHRDLNPLNNDISNLFLLTDDYHKSLHGKLNYPKGSLFGANVNRREL